MSSKYTATTPQSFNRHALAVDKLQLRLYCSNGALEATGDMYTICDEEAKNTVT